MSLVIAMHSSVRCDEAHLEGLISHKNVSVQGEAELAPLEEGAVCLRVLAVCAQAAYVTSWCLPHTNAGMVPTNEPTSRTVAISHPPAEMLVREQPTCMRVLAVNQHWPTPAELETCSELYP